jgi:hypothetical protein
MKKASKEKRACSEPGCVHKHVEAEEYYPPGQCIPILLCPWHRLQRALTGKVPA